MIQKLHHTVTDGVGGLRLAERFLDLERSPVEPDARRPVTARTGEVTGPSVGRAHGRHRRPPHPAGGRHHR